MWCSIKKNASSVLESNCTPRKWENNSEGPFETFLWTFMQKILGFAKWKNSWNELLLLEYNDQGHHISTSWIVQKY